MNRPPSLLAAMDDERFFRPWFKDPASWWAWRAVIKMIECEHLTEEEAAFLREATGRESLPNKPVRELWLGAGRRSGKSFLVALLAVWWSISKDWTVYLNKGEVAYVLILATDRNQCRTIFNYCLALLTECPSLAGLVSKETADEIVLHNRVTISITTASYRGVRGRTVIAACLDECSFWRSNDDVTANPAEAVLEAILPSMATAGPEALLLCASSLYARRGPMYQAFKDHHGNNSSPAVFLKAATRQLNPSVPQSFIDRALERDRNSAMSEYLSEWRADISAWIDASVLQRVVVPGRLEMGPAPGVQMLAFADPSGGSSDSMTLAIGYQRGDVSVLCAIREARAPYSPDGVVAEHAALLKDYGIFRVVGDRYAAEWVTTRYAAHGITYEQSPLPKSGLYNSFLGIINSGQCELLDPEVSPVMARGFSQLCALERRTGRGARGDTIDHPPGAMDDVANCIAGVMCICAGKASTYDIGALGDGLADFAFEGEFYG